MASIHQYDLFQSKEDILSLEIAKLNNDIAKLRRSLFARINQVEKLIHDINLIIRKKDSHGN
jgi:hypothetical protein